MPRTITIAALMASACLSVALAFADPAQVPYTWSSAPYGGGGFVSGLIYHPKTPGLMYARTDVGGAYRWDASKNVWIALNDSIAREDSQLFGILSLALDPNDASRVYIACGEYLGDWAHKAAIMRSQDRGASWSRTDLPFRLGGNSDGRSMGERLQVDPDNGKVLFLGTNRDGLWRSDDEGKSWSSVSSFPKSKVTLVFFDDRIRGAGKRAIYAGSEDLGAPSLYRSLDGGASWQPVSGAPQGLMPHHAAFDASGMLYLAYGNGPGPNNVTAGAVWKFDPGSGSWTDISPDKKSGFGYGGVSADHSKPGTVVVSTLDRWGVGDDIFLTTDGGASWTPLSSRSVHHADNAPWLKSYSNGEDRMGHWIGDVEIDPFDSNSISYVTGYGLWRTRNLTAAGKNIDWQFDVNGIEETVSIALASPPAGPHLVTALGDVGGASYAGANVDRITAISEPAKETNRSIDYAEGRPSYMVRTSDAAKTSGYYSVDGGKTWTPLAASPRVVKDDEGRYHTAGRIAVSAGGQSLLWAPEHQTAYYSEDGGVTWHESAGWPQAKDETFIPVADRGAEGVFYTMDRTKGNVFMSIDGGKTFTAIVRGGPQWGGEMRAVPGRVRALWVPMPSGLYYSPDMNSAFKPVKGITEAYSVGIGKAAPGSDNPAVYVAGKIKKVSGIFRSDDNGETWVRIDDDQHRFGEIGTLTGDPRIYGRVYIAAGGRGVMVGNIADQGTGNR